MDRVKAQAERIVLVSATAEHARLLYDIFTGENAQKYNRVAKPDVKELARRLGQSGRVFSEKASSYRFFGEIDGMLFGTFVAKNIDWVGKEAEIGYSLLDDWQGKGLGTALVYACVKKIFAESELERLWATVSVTNAASIRVMRRIGFRDCGLYKEAFRINGKQVAQAVYRMNRGESDCSG